MTWVESRHRQGLCALRNQKSGCSLKASGLLKGLLFKGFPISSLKGSLGHTATSPLQAAPRQEQLDHQTMSEVWYLEDHGT